MAEQILYSFCESLVRRQAEAERVMLEKFRKGTYTIEKPFVKINPYLINPLAAVVMFMTEEETASDRNSIRERSAGKYCAYISAGKGAYTSGFGALCRL